MRDPLPDLPPMDSPTVPPSDAVELELGALEATLSPLPIARDAGGTRALCHTHIRTQTRA